MVWVFGYGSLMWRPGFAHEERRPAVLQGWHRAFCRYSLRHRGTPERPGLVIGLKPGGECVGAAYRIDPAQEAAALAYLDEREGAGYLRERLPVRLSGAGESATVSAWTYVPNPGHPSYFGETDLQTVVALVATGVGESGTAYAYLRDMLEQIGRLGVDEPELADVLRHVERRRARERLAGD